MQDQTLALMQQILDRYHAGVTIDAVQIQNANPPAEVVPAYQDIARAGQDAQSSINEANTYRNRVVNEAKGTAAKITQAAEGYRQQVIARGAGPGRALRPGLRAVPPRAGGDPRAALHRDHAEGAGASPRR